MYVIPKLYWYINSPRSIPKIRSGSCMGFPFHPSSTQCGPFYLSQQRKMSVFMIFWKQSSLRSLRQNFGRFHPLLSILVVKYYSFS